MSGASLALLTDWATVCALCRTFLFGGVCGSFMERPNTVYQLKRKVCKAIIIFNFTLFCLKATSSFWH